MGESTALCDRVRGEMGEEDDRGEMGEEDGVDTADQRVKRYRQHERGGRGESREFTHQESWWST